MQSESYISFSTATPSNGTSLDALAREISSRADVEWVAMDSVVWISDAAPSTSSEVQRPDDPEFAEQWGLAAVGAPAAWPLVRGAETRSSAVTVCVVDSGIDYTHRDLVGNIAAAVGTSVIAGDLAPQDLLYHGTHVAGIIGAMGNNTINVSGMVWGNVSLLSCRFIDSNGYGYISGAVSCIDYCLQQGAKVIQNSWGGTQDNNAALEAAILAAENANALFVASAGNSAVDVDDMTVYPAYYSLEYSNVLAVASIGTGGALSSFSNYGNSTVALAAPGENILSTVPSNGTGIYSGTSMAAPFVSGAAALILSLPGAEVLTAQHVKAILIDSAEKLPSLAGKIGGGKLRLDLAVRRAIAVIAAMGGR